METITSRKNPIYAHIKKLGGNRTYRQENGEFLCDGLKLLEEAAKNGANINTVITAGAIPFPLPSETRVYTAAQGLIDSLSPLKNAQDVLFVCKMPEETDTNIEMGTQILLDQMQDPGNVGTILRTAYAFGICCVILTEGCADIYNPKTIRASMGAIFKQKTRRVKLSGIASLKTQAQNACAAPTSGVNCGVRLIGATLEKNSKEITEIDLKNSIIAIGNEGAGLSTEVLSHCDERVTIPIAPGCESLNAAAAAAIIMWEAKKGGDAFCPKQYIGFGCHK